MDPAAFAGMNAIEDRHWWFVARRAIIDKLITGLALPQDARILEAGCGTGGNLAMLSQHGSLAAFEFDDAARAIAAEKRICPVAAGHLPDAIGTNDDNFDLIAMLDVLEHIDDDVGSLAALGRRLATSGRLLVTVPAIPALWSAHDVLHHHKRRYTKRSLQAAVGAAGLRIDRIGYFNSLLLPIAAAQRLAAKALGWTEPVDAVPAAPVNAALRTVFAAERHIVGRSGFPIGLSLYAIIR
ncbi:MAG: class I SAM-dependent methyltransferase [Sphingopyxis sp.]|nr:class I SAM-dependent methyltransferase [Sphingopyxis sp.]